MPEISALYIYPVKSCAGISLTESEVGPLGLAYDRRFVIVSEDGLFITQREAPALARVRTELRGAELLLRVDGAEVAIAKEVRKAWWRKSKRVRIWEDEVDAVVADSSAAELLSELLKRRVSLVYMPEAAARAVDPRYAGAGDIVSFADEFPVLVATQASLDDLNARITAADSEKGATSRPIPMNRFRPNVVLAGTRAFEEDERPSFTAGGVSLKLVKPCSRCAIVMVDQAAGTVGKEPLATLAKYRTRDQKTYFAMNALVAKAGTLHVGDAVTWGA